jgi:hypothetical protein
VNVKNDRRTVGPASLSSYFIFKERNGQMEKFKTVGVVVVMAVISCVFAGSELWAADDLVAKQVVAEAKNIKNENPDFLIKLWTEGDKDSYKAEDVITFMFAANKECFVTLLAISTDGSVSRIFPNRWHKEGKVEKDKVYTIPPKDADFIFRVKGPEGTEYIKAIATLDTLKSTSQLKDEPKEEFAKVEDPEMVMKNIKIELKQKDTKNWSETMVAFTISDPQKDQK